jgi:hypothetical protein
MDHIKKLAMELVTLTGSPIRLKLIDLDGEPGGVEGWAELTSAGNVFANVLCESAGGKQYLSAPFHENGESIIGRFTRQVRALSDGGMVALEVKVLVFKSTGPWSEHAEDAGFVVTQGFDQVDLDNAVEVYTEEGYTSSDVLEAYQNSTWVK